MIKISGAVQELGKKNVFFSDMKFDAPQLQTLHVQDTGAVTTFQCFYGFFFEGHGPSEERESTRYSRWHREGTKTWVPGYTSCFRLF